MDNVPKDAISRDSAYEPEISESECEDEDDKNSESEIETEEEGRAPSQTAEILKQKAEEARKKY